jgi:hypothetical protein
MKLAPRLAANRNSGSERVKKVAPHPLKSSLESERVLSGSDQTTKPPDGKNETR